MYFDVSLPTPAQFPSRFNPARLASFFLFSSPLSHGRFPIRARLHVKISARSVYFRRKTRVARGACLRACARGTGGEKVRAISRATSLSFSLSARWLQQVEEGKRPLLHHPFLFRGTHLPNPNGCPLMCIARALALNMLPRASCQRRSKVPSRTTYCGDSLFPPLLSFLPCRGNRETERGKEEGRKRVEGFRFLGISIDDSFDDYSWMHVYMQRFEEKVITCVRTISWIRSELVSRRGFHFKFWNCIANERTRDPRDI